MSSLASYLGARLNLDEPWVSHIEFQESKGETEDKGIAEEQIWIPEPIVWLYGLLKFSLDQNASAVYVRVDRRKQELQQFICTGFAEEHDRWRWLELVPFRLPEGIRPLRAIRVVAMMIPLRRRGWVQYVYRGRRQAARARALSRDDIGIELIPGQCLWKQGCAPVE